MYLRACPPIFVERAAQLKSCRPPAPRLRKHLFRVRVKRISQAGRGIEPGDAVAALSANVGERAARQNLAVRLHRDWKNIIVRVRVEDGISQSGRGIEPGDAIARLSADVV